MIVYIQSFSLVIIEILCCKIFFETLSKKRTEKNILINFGIILALVVFGCLAALALYNNFIAKQVVVVCITALFMFFYLRISFLKSLILSALFQGLLLVIDYFTLFLNISIFQSMSEIGETHHLEGSLLVALGKVFLFIIVLIIRKYMGKDSSTVLRDTEWLRFIFFPVFTICTIIAMITTSGSIINQKQEDIFLTIAICLAGMNIVVFYLINDILKREVEIHENKIFQLQVKNQTSMYKSVSEKFDRQRKKTHEYKNQILCIESLIAKKNYQELEKYVSSVSGRLSKEFDSINTNNVIVDAILNSKYQEILDKNIVFVFKINDLSDIKISDEDVVIILSNLLNNAIEACEKCHDKKIIKMKFVKEEESVILSIKNTYNTKIIFRDGEIQTTKKYELDEHGIGFKNIVDTIIKYGGSYVVQNEDKEFYFSMIIPI